MIASEATFQHSDFITRSVQWVICVNVSENNWGTLRQWIAWNLLKLLKMNIVEKIILSLAPKNLWLNWTWSCRFMDLEISDWLPHWNLLTMVNFSPRIKDIPDTVNAYLLFLLLLPLVYEFLGYCSFRTIWHTKNQHTHTNLCVRDLI